MSEERKRERVQKIIANAGISSRRAAEEMIRSGRVTVEGRRATLGDRAAPGCDAVCIDGVPVEGAAEQRYLALNKPVGVVTTADDPGGRPTVLDLVEGLIPGGLRLFPVGRLDMDSSGLLILTNDGFLAHRLMHPSFEVPREYLVEVEPTPSPEGLARLRKGVLLEDGNTGPARVSIMGGRGRRAQLRVVLHAGRKRQIRRSFEHLGCRVLSLYRVRIGSLGLGALKPGEARELTRREVRSLYSQVGIKG